MIRAILILLANLLPKPTYRNRNVTIIYPHGGRIWEFNHPIYETTTSMDDELGYQNEIWIDDEIALSRTSTSFEHEWHNPDEWGLSFPDMNPATGLPMMDDCFDITGSPYGFDNTSDFFSADMDMWSL